MCRVTSRKARLRKELEDLKASNSTSSFSVFLYPTELQWLKHELKNKQEYSEFIVVKLKSHPTVKDLAEYKIKKPSGNNPEQE